MCSACVGVSRATGLLRVDGANLKGSLEPTGHRQEHIGHAYQQGGGVGRGVAFAPLGFALWMCRAQERSVHLLGQVW